MNISERMEHDRVAGLSLVAIDKGKISKADYFGISEAGTDNKINEHTMSKPFSVLMDELIFQPLNMTNSIFSTNIPSSNTANLACGHDQNRALISGKYSLYPYLAACGIWTTPNDLAKLLLDIMNAVKGQSKIGLTATQINELFRPQGSKEWTGLGVFLDGADEKLEFSSLGWGVGFQCMLVAYPYLEKGMIMMTNTDTGVHQMKGIMGEIYHSLS